MKQLKKKDIIYLLIIIISFIGLVFFLTNTTYIYGSTLDWYVEHISIPEYIRTLFYKTHDLLPDFAFNIGSGQNIYNFSYYGLLSPIILISYLFPKVPMMLYMIISTIVMVLISAILIYIFLQKKNYSKEICLISTLLFVFSAPISFHSHRHLMFITYMPFLILGLFGVDRVIDKNKSLLLAISTFLMIMTNYYFSIGGILCLLLYGLYRYLTKMNKATIKSFMQTLMKVLTPIIIGILISTIITLPTFALLINNRASSNITISFKDLFIPNIKGLIFDTYGLGLNVIIIPALINMFTKDKAHKIFGFILSIISTINIFNYLLNGTMYIDAKSLIPLLPLYIIVIAIFIKDMFDNKVNYKTMLISLLIVTIIIAIERKFVYLYLIEIVLVLLTIFIFYKTNNKKFFIIPMYIIILISAFITNKIDSLELRYTTLNNEKIVKNVINDITSNDNDFYRIANYIEKTETNNKTYENSNYYNSTIYSSLSSQLYNKFYYDTLSNNIPTRNRAFISTTNNPLSLILTNNKYFISTGEGLLTYNLVTNDNNIKVYKNDNVLPIGFATSNIMSYEDFDKLNDQVKNEALLNVIVADAKTDNKFVPNIKETDLDFKEIFKSKEIKEEKDDSLTIDIKNPLKLKYELPDKYKNKILFIRFKMNNIDCQDLIITINGVKNKLTDGKWKYFNGNTTFDYVLALNNQETLNISISEGKYNISDFESYYLDPIYIENVKDNVDEFYIDKETTKGDFINGDISVKEDGYFMMSIPYDKGFNIKIDNSDVKYEKVDNAFIGFKINKGNHHIEIEYKAPMKEVSMYVSLFGMFMLLITLYLESRRKI